MDHDGSTERRLTMSLEDDRYPDWSPRRTDIVYVSRRDGNEEIYTMKADGSGQTRLTDNSAQDTQPAWANVVRLPSGQNDATTAIAFVSNRDGKPDVYVMWPDGSGQARLTDSPGFNSAPHWSPDGTRLAFVSTRDGNQEIYVMNADGSGQTRLTDSPGADESPSWSPDGTRINFRSDRAGSREDYSMLADGKDQRRSRQQLP